MPTCSMRKVQLDALMLRLRRQKIDHTSTTAPSLRLQRVPSSNAALLKYALACQTGFPGSPVAAGSWRDAWRSFSGTTGPPAGVRGPVGAQQSQLLLHSNRTWGSQAAPIAGTGSPRSAPEQATSRSPHWASQVPEAPNRSQGALSACSQSPWQLRGCGTAWASRDGPDTGE